MATVIYYFSGTGNSLKIARDLAAELKDTEIIPVVKGLNSNMNLSYDKVGIVFPVYMWGLPLIIADFLKKLKYSKSYFFAVATYGGFPGSAILQARDILNSNGIKLSAGFTVHMPGNYTPMYGALAEGKQKRMFAKASEKVKKIAEFVKSEKSGTFEKSFPLLNWLFSKKFYLFASPQIPKMDKRFWVDEKCDGCGICEKVCPVSDITMENRKPKWHNRCQQCLACLQWCPLEAIQYGKSTADRKRYRHPEANARDFFTR